MKKGMVGVFLKKRVVVELEVSFWRRVDGSTLAQNALFPSTVSCLLFRHCPTSMKDINIWIPYNNIKII